MWLLPFKQTNFGMIHKLCFREAGGGGVEQRANKNESPHDSLRYDSVIPRSGGAREPLSYLTHTHVEREPPRAVTVAVTLRGGVGGGKRDFFL